jgi:hypothetical protein
LRCFSISPQNARATHVIEVEKAGAGLLTCGWTKRTDHATHKMLGVQEKMYQRKNSTFPNEPIVNLGCRAGA